MKTTRSIVTPARRVWMRIAGLVTVAIRRHGAWCGTRRRAGAGVRFPPEKYLKRECRATGLMKRVW
ncbi:MAG: hypothetical protein J4G05_09970 [Chlorobi bacterium]|nr:hypothetical protein [Chlorobiota bacterium]